MLWGRSGNRCAFSTCRRPLVEDETETDDPSVVGDEAHIVAREKDGPRGESTLTPEQRDKYDNLILVCKIHHKLIDDQPNKYTVRVLIQMKQDHLDWVSKNLSPDLNKQKDDEVYATYVDQLEELSFKNWETWTSYIFGNGQPQMSLETFNNLNELNKYIFSRIWPKRYDRLDFAFQNFRNVLNDFLSVFDKFKQKTGDDEYPWYTTEKFYKRLKEFNEEKYDILSKKFDFHVDLVEDLGLELTRAANYLCDQIRHYLSSSFRLKEGVLLVTAGPSLDDLRYKTQRHEFSSQEIEHIRYPGLRKFMETRQERGRHYGEGISSDY